MAKRESGQAAPLLLALVALGLLAVMATGRLVAAWAAGAQARTAADAAALACLQDGEPGAARAASANGAQLLSAAVEGDACTVEVGRGPAHARARAAWREVAPGRSPP